GYSASLRRGFWKLTPEGTAFAQATPGPLSESEIEALAKDHKDVRLRPSDGDAGSAALTDQAEASAKASPDDRLEQALGELRQAVAAELLEQLSQVSPH